MFLKIFRNNLCPIGVVFGSEKIMMAQLAVNHGNAELVAGACDVLAGGAAPYSGQWQRTVIESIRSIYDSVPFKSRYVTTTIHPSEVFSREIKMSAEDVGNIDGRVPDEVAKILPFRADGALVKYIVLENAQHNSGPQLMDVLVMATEKSTVEKHLAIFEKASLKVNSIMAWPAILVECYARFFGRRYSDADVNVLLIEASGGYCNVVICRQNRILFARMIPMGPGGLEKQTAREKLIAEINACIHYFHNSRNKEIVERIILFGSSGIDKKLCDCVQAVAKNQLLPAHTGDVFGAVLDKGHYKKGIDRRNSPQNWTVAFGLSLAGKKL